MNPNACGIAFATRHQAQQLLAKSFAILTGAQRLPHNQRRANRDDRQVDDVEQPRDKTSHAGFLSRLAVQLLYRIGRGPDRFLRVVIGRLGRRDFVAMHDSPLVASMAIHVLSLVIRDHGRSTFQGTPTFDSARI